MSTGKYVLKSIGTHIIAMVVVIFVASTLRLFFQEQIWYQYILSILLFCFYWYFVRYSTEKIALTDIKKVKFKILKPILSALAISIINIMLVLLDIFVGAPDGNDFFKLLFRYWNPAYVNFLIMFKDKLLLCIIITVSYFPMSVLCYYSGMIVSKREKKKLAEAPSSNIKDDEV